MQRAKLKTIAAVLRVLSAFRRLFIQRKSAAYHSVYTISRWNGKKLPNNRKYKSLLRLERYLQRQSGTRHSRI